MKKTLLALLLGSALVLGACGGKEKVKEEGTAGTETVKIDAEKIAQANCISCHGETLEGRGNFPNISKIGATLSKDEILDVVKNGKGNMPKINISSDEAEAVAKWLSEKK
ncbi:cytochrome c [Viridibacillus sp. YIM B01967]|uniref:Cytochrome c n=1 Tax=Viridibacillus soli TaxID=2798301 RepID=A0ABS1H9L8_9BACL|nr:cytochrome c [Viridibacillus soli]MBK3495989.1 cytochrome c [Viridibacillus soli]